MEPQPHQRKIAINLFEEEHQRHHALTHRHPEWVRKNGDCPSCISLEHEMADTSHPDAALRAMIEQGQ